MSEEKHSVIMERLMKSGMIATTAFELITGGFEFYSGADNIQNAVEKEMNPLESTLQKYWSWQRIFSIQKEFPPILQMS